MTQRTRTLQQLLDAVADRADVAYATSGVRHTTALMVYRINQAIQRWKAMVADAGDDADLLTVSTTTSSSATRDAKNWAPQQYLAQPANLMRVRGLDIYPIAGRPLAMLPADDLERDDAFRFRVWWGQGGTGLPVLYRMGGTNNAGQQLIQIFPWADAVYPVDIRYVPNWVDLTVSDLAIPIDFLLGGDEWVVNDAALQTLTRDGQAGGSSAQLCRNWNVDLEQKMRFELAKRSPLNKLDTRERRRELLARANPMWRVL